MVIDPLTTEATARASYELISAHLGQRPVTAVIYTHSHVDHFGGVLGVTSQADALSRHRTSGLPAGNRRRKFYCGARHGPPRRVPVWPTTACRAHRPRGLRSGQLHSTGRRPGGAHRTDGGYHGELLVDGVRVVFQLTPETEAPAEMNFFFPDSGWLLCMCAFSIGRRR